MTSLMKNPLSGLLLCRDGISSKEPNLEFGQTAEREKIIGCKWVFKKKLKDKETRFKAQLVAKCYSQKEGVDFNEVFSHVVKHTSFYVLLVMVAHFDLDIEQLDAKTEFLHGELEDDELARRFLG